MSANATSAAPTGRKKLAQGKERSDAALGYASQNTSSSGGAEESRKRQSEIETGAELLARILTDRRKEWKGRGQYKEPATPDTANLPKLPFGWTWATADQLTSVITDGEHITPVRAESGILLLSARNVLDGRLSLEDVDYVPQHEYERIAKRLVVAPGDVLLSCSGSVGRSTVVPDGLLFTLVRSVAVLKPLAGMGKYLSTALRAPLLKQQITEKQTQTAQANIFQGKIKALCIPLAPLPEQRRIVAEIEKQFTRLEAGVAALRRVQANLKRYRAAVLKAACDGELVPPKTPFKEWSALRLADVCKSITDGDHQPPPKRPQGIPLLTIGNISSGRLDFSDTRFVPEEYYNQIKPDRIPNRDEVLYSVVGATIGIPVLVDTDRLFCFSRHVALLKPAPRILPKFLWLHMASPDTHREAWRRITGSAQPTLALRPLREMPIKLPPLAEQTRIVAEVERRLSVVEELESVVSANLQRATRLRQSILQKAFTGELI